MILRSVVAIGLILSIHCPENGTGGVVRETLGARHEVERASQMELRLRCKTQSRRLHIYMDHSTYFTLSFIAICTHLPQQIIAAHTHTENATCKTRLFYFLFYLYFAPQYIVHIFVFVSTYKTRCRTYACPRKYVMAGNLLAKRWKHLCTRCYSRDQLGWLLWQSFWLCLRPLQSVQPQSFRQ